MTHFVLAWNVILNAFLVLDLWKLNAIHVSKISVILNIDVGYAILASSAIKQIKFVEIVMKPAKNVRTVQETTNVPFVKIVISD